MITKQCIQCGNHRRVRRFSLGADVCLNCKTYKGLSTPNKHLLLRKEKSILFNQARDKLIHKDNVLEELIQTYLQELNIRFIREKGILTRGAFCIFDFYLIKPYKMCIEVDGPSHDNPRQRARDYYKDKCVQERRWRILRLHHTQMPRSKEELLERINKVDFLSA